MNSSLKNKLNRKLKKYSNILKKEFNIETSPEPSSILMVCNVSIGFGLSNNNIVDFFSNYGQIKSALFIPNKAYSFITYENISNAVDCYEQVNGKQSLESNHPIYLLYIKSVPCIENDSLSHSQVPPGAILLEDFIDYDEEKNFLSCANEAFQTQIINLKQRQVYHFGYEFIYGENNIDKNKPLENKIPKICDIIPHRLNEKGILVQIPDQLTLNSYSSGQGIPPHIDTHSAFEDNILILSLGSDYIMDFKKDPNNISILLKRRSMLILAGESRYAWTHGISSRKSDYIYDKDGSLIYKDRGTRVSFTFRKILKGECKCDFPEFCDSQMYKNLKEEPSHLEKHYVHKVYENISDHFSQTRYKAWPKVLSFIQSFSLGSIVLDVGCGNGKYFNQSSGTYEIGCDYSQGLTDICRQRGLEVLRSNCLYLPFKDNFSDGILSIAVLHHLSTPERRSKGIQEIIRVLKPGGKALIYVWAKEQKQNQISSKYLKVDKSIDATIKMETKNESCTLPVHVNRTEFTETSQDILVPWKTQKGKTESSTFLRYYHVFKENELENICKTLNCIVLDSYHDNGNWCVILSKELIN